MNRTRSISIALGLALALGFPATAAASTTITYAIAGVETAATETSGTFAGVAVASDDYGTWLATIDHARLSTSSPWTTSITGGPFRYDGVVRDITGTFTGGTLTQKTGFRGCMTQTFDVSGTMTLTAPSSGRGEFTATLTHYRKWVPGGGCVTFAASVSGTVTFTGTFAAGS